MRGFEPVEAVGRAAHSEEDDDADAVEDGGEDDGGVDGEAHPAEAAEEFEEEDKDGGFDEEDYDAVEGCGYDCDLIALMLEIVGRVG